MILRRLLQPGFRDGLIPALLSSQGSHHLTSDPKKPRRNPLGFTTLTVSATSGESMPRSPRVWGLSNGEKGHGIAFWREIRGGKTPGLSSSGTSRAVIPRRSAVVRQPWGPNYPRRGRQYKDLGIDRSLSCQVKQTFENFLFWLVWGRPHILSTATPIPVDCCTQYDCLVSAAQRWSPSLLHTTRRSRR